MKRRMMRCIAALSLCLLVLSGCRTATPEGNSSAPLSSESFSDTAESTTQTTVTTDVTADTATTAVHTATTTAGTATTIAGTVTAGTKTTTTGKKVVITAPPPIQKKSLLDADPSRAPSDDVFQLSRDCIISDGYVYYHGGPNTYFDYITLFRKPLTGGGEATQVLRIPDWRSFPFAVCENKLYYMRSDPNRLYVCDLNGNNEKLLADFNEYGVHHDPCYVTKDWVIYNEKLSDGSLELYLHSTDGKTKKAITGVGKDKLPCDIQVIGFNRGYFYYQVSYRLKESYSTVGTSRFRVDYRSKNPTPEELDDRDYNGIVIEQSGPVQNDYIYQVLFPGETPDSTLYKSASLLNGSKQELVVPRDYPAPFRLWDYFVFTRGNGVYEYMDWKNNRKTVQIPHTVAANRTCDTFAVPNTNYMYQWVTTEHSASPYSATAVLTLFDPEGTIYKICEVTV